MAEQIDIKISQESITQIIGAHVQAAVASALSKDSATLIDTLVRESLLVRSNAEEYRYNGSKPTPTVLEHMVRVMLREEAEKGIKAWAEENRAEIAKKIKASINKAGFANKWAAQVVEAMLGSNSYSFHTVVTTHHSKD